MKRPRITRKVLDGICTAIGALEADGFQTFEKCPEYIENMERAYEWAQAMIAWMDRNRTENKP